MCVAEGTDGRGDGRIIGRRIKLLISSGREECLGRFLGGRGSVMMDSGLGLDAKWKQKFLTVRFGEGQTTEL